MRVKTFVIVSLLATVAFLTGCEETPTDLGQNLNQDVAISDSTAPAEPSGSFYTGVEPEAAAKVAAKTQNQFTCTGGETDLLIQDNVPWFDPGTDHGLGANVEELLQQEINFCMVTSDQIGSVDLSQFSGVFIAGAQTQVFYDNLFPGGEIHPDLTAFVEEGGVLLAHLTDRASGPGGGGHWLGDVFLGGVEHVSTYRNENNIRNSSHPIISDALSCPSGNCAEIVDGAGSRDDLDDWGYDSHGYFINLPQDADIILTQPDATGDGVPEPVVVEYSVGNGTVIASLTTTEWRYGGGSIGQYTPSKKLLANEIAYQNSIIDGSCVGTLNQRAACMARNLAGGEYLLGAKGFDYDNNKYASKNDILVNGYTYWNARLPGLDFGHGIDCSGLVLWSYNTAAGATKLKDDDNPILFEGADGQFNGNTEPIPESELRAGDLLFFDDPKGGRIDHVAMYLGGDQVVEAKSREAGIKFSKLSVLTEYPEFEDFRRVNEAREKMAIKALSPVDLAVTDPDGLTIDATTLIVTEREILREVPRELYYSEADVDGDGELDDMVYSPKLKRGNYIIKVIPEADAAPSDTYTLVVEADDQVITLEKDASIEDIPDTGFGVRNAAEGIVEFTPVSVDIKPGSDPSCVGARSRGRTPVAILETNIGVTNIDVGALEIDDDEDPETPGVQPVRSSVDEDVNGDGKEDLVLHFNTEDLKSDGLLVDQNELTITGYMRDGTLLIGTDTICVVPRGR